MDEANNMATDGQQEDQFADMRNAKPWLEMLEESEKAYADWHAKCDNINKQYADLKKLSNTNIDREMQIFWANMEVLKPAIYARAPVPVVSARFKDRKPMIRHGAETLERALISTFEMDDIHETMKLVRDDVALSGRGSPWVRIKSKGDYAYICYEHVDRKDFRHGVARKWKEVPWVARRTFETRDVMLERFAEAQDVVMGAEFEERSNGMSGDEKQGEKKAEVWELWHKDKGVVVWVTPGAEQVLDIREPYLDLQNFFPCPRPAFATLEPSTLIPVPDFLYVKDQLEEINELTARISALSESLRLKGFYSAGNEDVGDAIETAMKSMDNNSLLIPVPNVAALGGQGMDKAIIWMPINEVAQVITALVALRKQLIDDVYQITGISDIMRGSTDSKETLGAQQLKSQYGSVRIREKQEELIRIARDLARLAGEIIAENFGPDDLYRLSQYDEAPREQEVMQEIASIDDKISQAQTDPRIQAMAQQNPDQAKQLLQQANARKKELQEQVTFEQVSEFLSSERTRPFLLDIETDSTIQPDENAQKQRVTEFMTALGGTLQQIAPMIAQEPETAGFAGEVLKMAVSPFRVGRTMADSIDELVEQMKAKAGQPQENPESQKAEMEAKVKQGEMQLKMQEMQMDMQAQKQESAIKIEQAQADVQKTSAEIEKIMAEIQRINAQAIAASQKPQNGMDIQ